MKAQPTCNFKRSPKWNWTQSNILAFLTLLSLSAGAQTPPTFRFHLVNEPSTLRTWEQKNSNASYLLSQVTGTLMTYQDHKLSPNLAEKCSQKTPKKLTCRLRKDLKWSDGSPLTAQDFERSFQQFLNPANRAYRADLLFPIKNAQKIFKGELPPEKLGISTKGPDLNIEFENPDSEFIYTLTSPLTAPLPATPIPSVDEVRVKPAQYLSSGAYLFSSWEAQKKIVLIPNPHFWSKSSTRPTLEVITVNEDSVALSLYEKRNLSFLRRLPTLYIPQYKGKPEYFEVDQFRFDYIGFSPKITDPHLRKALAYGLNYPELQALYHAHAPPGCVGIREALTNEKFCHEKNLEKAKIEWALAKNPPHSLELFYSKQGGDDHKRGMEWFQAEWKKNLGLNIDLNALENKVFVEKIEKNPPDIFRKGIAPDRPTCLSALETFETGSIENYLQFRNKNYDSLLEKMRSSLKETEKKKLCTQALHLLMDDAYLIPTGPIHFTLLADPQWKGWKLNELNQLDLSGLSYQP